MYTITVTNNGPSAEPAGVVISDPIPAGTVGSGTEADCAIAAGTFTCTTSAPIASGGFVIYQLTLTVTASYAPANVSNTATITSAPTADSNAANNAATDTDIVTTSADLEIIKTDSTDPVIPGQALTYTLTVTNNGPSDAANVQVSDTVPAQFTVTNVTSRNGCLRPRRQRSHLHAAHARCSRIIWSSPCSSPPTSFAAPGTYTNTATVSAATADAVPGNDSGSQDTTIVPSADLSIVKSDSADPVNPGTSFDYVIVVTNNGPSDASSLTVTDTIPAAGSFSITGIVASAGSCGNVGNDLDVHPSPR